MRRILSLLLVTMLALSTAGYAEPFLEEEVVFGDPVLENIMRKIVGGDGALTRKALAGVREVSIGVDGDSTPDSEKVHDLSGLEYCEDLFNLSIFGHAVADISPLAGLTNLEYLDLGSNPIGDLSALSELHILKGLTIYSTGVRDLSPLAGCAELNMLYAQGNKIEDISVLTGMTQLTALDLGENGIRDISPLAGLTKLTELYLWNNQIEDASALAGLSGLKTLELAENDIRDARPIAGLTQLTMLHLGGNPIEDWSVLSAIYPNLSDSDFSPDQIPDGTVIAFDDPVLEAKIREAIGKPEGDVTYGDARSYQGDLYASYSGAPGEEKIHSIEALRYFTGIFKFEAFGQDIRDLEPLRDLKNLGILALDGNPVSDLAPIAGLENLMVLQISYIAEAPDLSPIVGLKNLGTLLARNDRIEDISALAALTNLDALDLSYNNISDLSALSGLAKLTSLRLSGNPVTDFVPIREILPNITDKDFEPLFAEDAPETPIVIAQPAFEAALRRAMNIYDRPITERDAYLVREIELANEKTKESAFSDISPLKYFVNLKTLTFNANPITDISALQGLTKLNSLYISFSQVNDLAPLSGLVNLAYLNFDFCPVENFSPLAGLVNLRGLGADNCPVRDLAPLAGLVNLNNLSLKDCLVEDVSPLASLTNLKRLFLQGCPVTDFSPLQGIYPNLETKDFEIAPAKSGEAPVAKRDENSMFQDPMFEKRVRKMLNKPEGDIDPAELAGIRELYFNNWDYPYGEIPEEEKVYSLADLKYFPNLEKLDIGGNAVSDLSPISALKKLYYLEAPKNNISDLSPLADMTQLTWAVFWENDISDLTPVSNLVNLETFSVFSNNVSDISPLANLTKLTILELRDNPFEDYSPVVEIYPNLREKDFTLDEPEQKENTSSDSAIAIEGWRYEESTRTLTIDSDAAMIAHRPDQENAESAMQTNTPWAANLGQIENIIVGDDVTLISDYAFAYASALKKITIGEGVSALGFRCLYRCGNLGAGEDLEIIVNCDNMPALGEDVMGYTWDSPHTSLIVPASQADQWRESLGEVGLRIVVQ